MKETGQSKWYVLNRMTLFEINLMLADQPRTLTEGKGGDAASRTLTTDDDFASL